MPRRGFLVYKVLTSVSLTAADCPSTTSQTNVWNNFEVFRSVCVCVCLSVCLSVVYQFVDDDCLP